MTNDIRDRLMGVANKEAIEAAQRANGIPGFLRERYPLADFEGTFTGEVREFQETTPNGQTFTYPAVGVKVQTVHRKFDANYQTPDVYWIRVDEPKPDKVDNSAIGHMVASGFEHGINFWESKGQLVRYVLDSFKPFPNSKDEKYAKITTCFYKLSPAGASQQVESGPSPAAEKVAVQFASGMTEADFTREAIKALSDDGVDDNALFTEIAQGKFLDRMVKEGKLALVDGVYALV